MFFKVKLNGFEIFVSLGVENSVGIGFFSLWYGF